MNLQSCIIKSIPNCICIRFLRCLVRTHESLHPTRNNYQRTFPTLGCRVFVSISSLQTVLATDKSWHPPRHQTSVSPDKAGRREQIFQRAARQMAPSHLNFDHSAVVANGQCRPPLLLLPLWSPAALSKHWCAATAPLCGETSKMFTQSVRPVVGTVKGVRVVRARYSIVCL